MGDLHKPPQYAGNTTYHESATARPAGMVQPKLNPSYLRTIGFPLTVIELVLCLIVIICIGSTRETDYQGIGFGIFTAVMGLLLGFAVFGVRFFDIHENVQQFPWALFWLGAHAFLSFCFFVSGAICIAAADHVNNRTIQLNFGQFTGLGLRESNARVRDGCAAAAFFAWIAAILYGLHAALYFLGSRNRSTVEEAPAFIRLPWGGHQAPPPETTYPHQTTAVPPAGQQSTV